MTTQPTEDISVSDATIRNWNRLGVSESERSAKLTLRANKRLSAKSFSPGEYAGNSEQPAIVDQLLHYAGQHQLEHATLLFFAMSSLARNYTNPFLTREIQEWESEINNTALTNRILADHKAWFARIFPTPLQGDFAGLLYQSLLAEGEKAATGSYFTPQSVARAMLEDHCTADSTVLDPACGTGQFLLEAANIVRHPAQLFGIDNDPTAVRIARINLMLRFPDLAFEPNIFAANTLLDDLNSKMPAGFFDLVVTNPPWGSHWSKQEKTTLAKRFPQIRSGESFSYFLVRAAQFAKHGGVISFLLPESLLNIKVHGDIRDFLSQHCQIRSIQSLGRLFTGVFTPVIRLDVVNALPPSRTKTVSVFAIHQADADRRLLQQIESCPTWNLKHHAQFALGIVTGNNARHVLKSPLPGSEPIYRGRDVLPFVLKPNSEYIVFQPEHYQQTAPEKLFRADEKLIYRFISNDLVFAYDDQQRLTLNSANLLIPSREDFPAKVLCAVLNSDLMRYVYRKKFNTLKVLRGNLEALPLPDFDLADQATVLSLADEFLETKDHRLLDKINQVVYRYFEIEKQDVRYIETTTNWNKSRNEGRRP